MADTASRGKFQSDLDIHITLEDQEKINLFARHNAKCTELKQELNFKEIDLKNLEDATDELYLLDDGEGTGEVPMQFGDNFVMKKVDDAVVAISLSKRQIEGEIKQLEETLKGLKSDMVTLKAYLYGKFGTHINLEDD